LTPARASEVLRIGALVASLLVGARGAAAGGSGDRPPTTATGTDGSASSLVFILEADPTCTLRAYDVRRATVSVVAPLAACPDELVTVDDRGSILLVDRRVVQEIGLSGTPVVHEPIPLPVPAVDPKELPGRAIAVGHTADGALAVGRESGDPDGERDGFVYVRDGTDWKLVEKIRCQKFESCAVGSRRWPRSPSEFEDEELRVWGALNRRNPYVTARETWTVNPGTEDAEDFTSATLRFGEQKTILTYSTRQGDHGDTLTMSVSIWVAGMGAIDLTDEQCETAWTGKHLLLERFWGKGTELIDLETGRSVLGRLKLATWMR